MKKQLLRSLLVACGFLSVFAIEIKAQSSTPTPDHVVLVILENHHYNQIIGSASAPYINSLANDSFSALFTHSFAIEHPSQPNYIDLFSGGNQGVTNDFVPANIPFSTPNLARQLLDAGKTFVTYSEDLPSQGYNGGSSGAYARKHNPVANWMGTGNNQVPDSLNKPLSAWPVDFNKLPTIAFVIPNQDNDMHNGTGATPISRGDQWVHDHLDSLVRWCRNHNSLFVLTFDEDDDLGNNQITTLFSGSMIKAGPCGDTINHYSMLRCFENMYGLAHIGNAASAREISTCWKTGTSLKEIKTHQTISLFPNPSNGWFHIEKNGMAPMIIRAYTLTGQEVPLRIDDEGSQVRIEVGNAEPGCYVIAISEGNKWAFQKLAIVR